MEPFTFRDRTNARACTGALAQPRGRGRAPALIVVHEWWGLNDNIRALCERFADEGILTLAVDLYDGAVTADPSEAARLAGRMKTADAMDTVGGAVAALAQHPGGNGKVGVTGFCLGGAMSLAAAANVEGLSAAVPFYGTPRDEFCTWDRVKCPIQGHYARRDTHVRPERVAQIEADLRAAGVNVQFHWYDADHAFMRQGDPRAYHAPSAALAWDRTLAFLHANLR